MDTFMMVSVIVSVTVIVMALVNVMGSKHPELTNVDAKIDSLMEVALKHAGGKGYYYVSGKEDFFESLSFKLITCKQRTFLSSKTYEVRNGLIFNFQVGDDRTGLDSSEEKMGDIAKDAINWSGTIGGNDSSSVRKKSENKHIMNDKTTPPRSIQRHETGHEISTCKVKVSLKINCDINFSNWSLWNLYLFWSSSSNNSEISYGHVKTISADYVLSMVNGWNEETKTATTELQYRVETERQGIYSFD